MKKMQIITIPRLVPKDAPVNSSGVKYINMEEKIREYMQHYNPIDMCFLFKERTENLDNELFLANDVKDIIAKVLSVGDTTATIQILDEEFFKKFEGRIYFAVSSLCEKTDDGYEINKVVRFEGKIK